MTDRPLIFSAPMVRAILDGTKTQTRLVPTMRNTTWDGGTWRYTSPGDLLWDEAYIDPGGTEFFGPGQYLQLPLRRPDGAHTVHRVRSKIEPGDKIWVKETWGAVWPLDEPVPLNQCKIEYRADLPPGCTDYPGDWPADAARGNPDAPKWRSSIHMPRWASRITLEVTGVRVQRLQDISEDDARAEGMPMSFAEEGRMSSIGLFASLWDSRHKPGERWDDNPWVVVLSFKRVEAW